VKKSKHQNLVVLENSKQTMILLFAVLLLHSSLSSSAQEIAFENFNYNTLSQVTLNSGGTGFSSSWSFTDDSSPSKCQMNRLPTNVTRSQFVSYSSLNAVGTSVSSLDRSSICGIMRPLNSGGSNPPTRYMSVLMTADRATQNGAFGIAIGDMQRARKWTYSADSRVELDDGTYGPVSVVATRSSQIMSFHMLNDGVAEVIPLTLANAPGPVAVFVVMRIERQASIRFQVQFAAYDVAGGSDVISEQVLNNARNSVVMTTNQVMLSTVSFGMIGFHLAQVRVGATFASVYNDLPMSLLTTTRLTTTTTSTTTTSTTTTPTTTPTTSERSQSDLRQRPSPAATPAQAQTRQTLQTPIHRHLHLHLHFHLHLQLHLLQAIVIASLVGLVWKLEAASGVPAVPVRLAIALRRWVTTV
jgi:hypothetical protein